MTNTIDTAFTRSTFDRLGHPVKFTLQLICPQTEAEKDLDNRVARVANSGFVTYYSKSQELKQMIAYLQSQDAHYDKMAHHLKATVVATELDHLSADSIARFSELWTKKQLSFVPKDPAIDEHTGSLLKID